MKPLQLITQFQISFLFPLVFFMQPTVRSCSGTSHGCTTSTINYNLNPNTDVKVAGWGKIKGLKTQQAWNYLWLKRIAEVFQATLTLTVDNSEPSMGALGYLKDKFRINHYTPTMLMEQYHWGMLTSWGS